MSAPMNGTTIIRMIQPALAQPDMSRRSTSANSAMNIQITMIQKKNTSVDQRTVPKVQCTAYLQRLVSAAQWSTPVRRGASSTVNEPRTTGADDIDASGRTLQPGSTAVLLVYENLWAAPLAVALRRAGAHLVATGRIPIQGILAALDDLEWEPAATQGS